MGDVAVSLLERFCPAARREPALEERCALQLDRQPAVGRAGWRPAREGGAPLRADPVRDGVPSPLAPLDAAAAGRERKRRDGSAAPDGSGAAVRLCDVTRRARCRCGAAAREHPFRSRGRR